MNDERRRCPAQKVIRNLAALRPRRSWSATRACRTALALPPAAACHPGHTLRPLAPAACVPAATPLRRSARAASGPPPLKDTPGGRSVSLRLLKARQPSRHSAQVAAPTAGQPELVALADSRQSFASS